MTTYRILFVVTALAAFAAGDGIAAPIAPAIHNVPHAAPIRTAPPAHQNRPASTVVPPKPARTSGNAAIGNSSIGGAAFKPVHSSASIGGTSFGAAHPGLDGTAAGNKQRKGK